MEEERGIRRAAAEEFKKWGPRGGWYGKGEVVVESMYRSRNGLYLYRTYEQRRAKTGKRGNSSQALCQLGTAGGAASL